MINGVSNMRIPLTTRFLAFMKAHDGKKLVDIALTILIQTQNIEQAKKHQKSQTHQYCSEELILNSE